MRDYLLKKIIILSASVCLVILVVLRVYYLNRDVKQSVIRHYKIGEVVPLEKDFNQTSQDINEGYTVQVREGELLDLKTFYQKYNLAAGQLAEDVFTKYYYVIRVNFANTTDETRTDVGMDLTQFYLYGLTYFMVIDMQVFSLLNDIPSPAFSLKQNSEKEILIPYAVRPDGHTDRKGMLKDSPNLQITAYPQRKLLAVN